MGFKAVAAPDTPLTLPLRGSLPLPQGERGKGVRFAGYAAVFDRPDRGGDVVRKGAFAATLKARGAIPLLWQHRPGVVIGRIEHLAEDERGLRVIGEIGSGGDAGRVAALLGAGKLDGLSFGYRVTDSTRAAGLRELRGLELIEVSVVAQPMQPQARIHALE
jgi:uncharacterized protein